MDTIDVRIITLKKSPKQHAALIAPIQSLLPHANVSIQPAMDFRKAKPAVLARAGLLSLSGFSTIRTGKKWHHEFDSTGGVGLIQSMRLALTNSHPERLMLLLEDDYAVYSPENFLRSLDLLVRHSEGFDVAVFGARKIDHQHELPPVGFLPSEWRHLIKGKFFHTHCVLYTASGKRAVSRLMEQPADMQVDALLGAWGETNMIRILVDTSNKTVRQKIHNSSIQPLKGCFMCNFPAVSNVAGLVFICVLGVALVCVWRQSSRCTSAMR